MVGGWAVYDFGYQHGIHVVPKNDLIIHTYVDCVCIPQEECLELAPIIYKHSSLDGRELHG